MLKRITKREAQKRFNDGKSIVYLCPCKFRPDGPFSMAVGISGKEYLEDAEGYRNHPTLWSGSVEKTAWDLMYDNWWHHNATYETGYYAHYYIQV